MHPIHILDSRMSWACLAFDGILRLETFAGFIFSSIFFWSFASFHITLEYFLNVFTLHYLQSKTFLNNIGCFFDVLMRNIFPFSNFIFLYFIFYNLFIFFTITFLNYKNYFWKLYGLKSLFMKKWKYFSQKYFRFSKKDIYKCPKTNS